MENSKFKIEFAAIHPNKYPEKFLAVQFISDSLYHEIRNYDDKGSDILITFIANDNRILADEFKCIRNYISHIVYNDNIGLLVTIIVPKGKLNKENDVIK